MIALAVAAALALAPAATAAPADPAGGPSRGEDRDGTAVVAGPRIPAVARHGAVRADRAQVARLEVVGPRRAAAGADVTITVAARDDKGRVRVDYRGTVTLVGHADGYGLPAEYTFTAEDRGRHRFVGTVLRAGRSTLTVTDKADPTLAGTTSTEVHAARAQTLVVTAAPQAVPGDRVDLTVTAQDAWGNVADRYRGRVAISVSDTAAGAAALPGAYRFTATDAGTHTFTDPQGVVLVSPGPQTVTVTDATRPAVTGSAVVAVTEPAAVDGLAAWAMGDNELGQLGTGSAPDPQPAPVPVPGPADWAMLGASSHSSAGIREDGTLWAWGNEGGLGVVPTMLGTDTDWVFVDPPLAIKTDGTLWSWRSSSFPRLQPPAQVGADADWSEVSTGLGHTLALKTDGTLWSWGDTNHWGQQGNGTTDPSLTALRIGTDAGWVAISAHVYQSAAVKADGTLWTWGVDATTVDESGTRQPRPVPVQVGAGTDWVAVDAGYLHTVALAADGSLWSWGYNPAGELGDGTTSTSAVPVQEVTHGTWTAVAAGDHWTVALAADGTLWTWGAPILGNYGEDGPGQFGIGLPRRVDGSYPWREIDAGQSHLLALR